MIDIFIRAGSKTPLRKAMLPVCLEGWKLQKGEKNVEITSGEGDPNFHWYARWRAERYASGDWYIFTDDDNLPLGLDFLERAERIAKENPDYVLISASSANFSEKSWPGTWHQPGVIIETSGVGGIVLHRKGVIDYSKFSGPCNSQDGIVCDWLKSKGLKFGMSLELHHNHLGYGYSESSEGWFGRF